jgi:hypothetical protein
MNSPLISITWELLARKRWATALVAFAFPISYGVNLLWPQLAREAAEGHRPGIFMPVEFITFLLSIATLFWLFSYAEPDRTGRQIGFPARTFALPLRTFQLVSIPVAFGVFSVVLYYWLWGALIFPQWGVALDHPMLTRQLLTVAAMLVTMQALVWSFHAFPWIRMILTAGLLVALGFAGVPEWDPRKISDTALLLILSGVFVAAWVGAIAGVARDRCGNWEGWTGKILQRVQDALPGRRRAFASQAQAQFWLEWQRKGWFMSSFVFALPVTVSIMLFVLPASLLLIDPRAGFILFAPVLLCLIMASTVGNSISKSDFWSPRPGLTSFVATRPATTGELVIAKLQVAIAVTLVGWAIIIALSPLAFNLPRWLLPSDFPFPAWTDLKQQFPDAFGFLLNPLFAVGCFGLTWQSIIAGFSIGSLARPNKVLVANLFGMLLFTFVMSGSGWLIQHPEFQYIVFPFLVWIAFGLALVKILTTCKAFVLLHTQALFTQRQFVGMIILWVLPVATILAGAWLFHFHQVIPNPLLLFLTAYFLPGPELPNCALHMAEDRHR